MARSGCGLERCGGRVRRAGWWPGWYVVHTGYGRLTRGGHPVSGGFHTHIRATPRIPSCRGELGAPDTRTGHAQTYTQPEKYAATRSTFFHTRRKQLAASRRAARPRQSRRRRAGRPPKLPERSCSAPAPTQAPLRPPRSSTPPGSHRQQQRRLREETGVDEKGPHPVAEPAASSSSMGVMALVGLEVSCSNKSNPGQRLVGYRCRRALLGNGTRAHLSIVRSAARAASRRSRLPNSVRKRCLRTRGG